MTWLMKLYLLTLKLYPRSFRDRFADEMEEVFRAGLEEARERNALVPYVLREARHLPASLMDVYIWSFRAAQRERMPISTTGGGGIIGGPLSGEGWGASLLGGLPNLLIGIVIASSALIEQSKGGGPNVFGYLRIAVVCLLLGVLLFSIHTGWRRWSASWVSYMFIFGVILLSLAANSLASTITRDNGWVYEVQTLAFPLLLAYLLYKITCMDRLRGLLAAVPPMAFLWSYFLEFVPAVPRALAWGWLFLLAFGASVMMLRARRFSAALALAMFVPVLGGFPFAYLGVYMGGTLPFSEPGPSLPEVWRQYLPFLVAILSIALGPQLAAKLRAIARNSTGTAGRVFYRLALAGVLLALALTLLHWITVSSGTPRWMYPLLAVRQVWPIAASLIYLAGFIPLLWTAMFRAGISGNHPAVLQLVMLFILLPGVPLVILLAMPTSGLSLYPTGSMLLAAEVAWVFAAAWAAVEAPSN